MRLAAAIFVACAPFSAAANDPPSVFAEQAHYELVYEYMYRANFVERLILECTADRAVWWSFGYATASLTNAYYWHVLGTSVFQRDPFTDQALISRLWQETILLLTRSSAARGDPVEPVLMAQRDVLRMVELYDEELDSLCDFAFWEEVGYLEDVVDDLLADADARLDRDEFELFVQRSESGLPLMRRLFAANPLKFENIAP